MSKQEVLVDARGETVMPKWQAKILAFLNPGSWGDEPDRTEAALSAREDYKKDKARWNFLRAKKNRTPEEEIELEAFSDDFSA